MLLFGHIGITAAVAKIGDTVFPAVTEENGKKGFRANGSAFVNRFRDASGYIDYRMVIIGSMLPDIIDKPLFLLFGNNGYFDGRGFSHSLFVQLLIISAGFLFKKTWLCLLAFGSLMHLVLDEIWHMPVTLFWPFMGWFTPRDPEGWLADIWNNLIHMPKAYIPEIIGIIICAWLGYRIVKGKGLKVFLRQGTID
ncbi:MAG: metal-dependent hydrolase [Dehalococcoidales bacterium]|nr:metal-dependent hydrolase [Dehalococcoidales bacterium]